MGDWTEGELRLDGDDSMDGVPFIVLVAGEEGGSKHRYVADVRCQWDGDEPVLNAESRANAERLAACWNAMRGIPDPSTFMADAYELLDRLETYFDQRSDVVDGDYGVQEPNAEMQHLTAVQYVLAKLGRG